MRKPLLSVIVATLVAGIVRAGEDTKITPLIPAGESAAYRLFGAPVPPVFPKTVEAAVGGPGGSKNGQIIIGTPFLYYRYGLIYSGTTPPAWMDELLAYIMFHESLHIMCCEETKDVCAEIATQATAYNLACAALALLEERKLELENKEPKTAQEVIELKQLQEDFKGTCEGMSIGKEWLDEPGRDDQAADCPTGPAEYDKCMPPGGCQVMVPPQSPPGAGYPNGIVQECSACEGV